MWPQKGDLDKAMQTRCEVWLRGEEGQVLGEVHKQGGKLGSSQGRGVGGGLSHRTLRELE